jgi:hypothetical protein
LSFNINGENSDPDEFENKKDLNQRFSCLRRKKEKEKVCLNKLDNSNSTVTFMSSQEKGNRKSFVNSIVNFRFPSEKKHELSNANSNIKAGFSTDHHFENE